jgi:hypothetical protein
MVNPTDGTKVAPRGMCTWKAPAGVTPSWTGSRGREDNLARLHRDPCFQ